MVGLVAKGLTGREPVQHGCAGQTDAHALGRTVQAFTMLLECRAV